MTTDYERGFAAGVEAAETVITPPEKWSSDNVPPGAFLPYLGESSWDLLSRARERIRALRAPSPAPTPREDAPLIEIAWLAAGDGSFVGRCPCGATWSGVRHDEIVRIDNAHARYCPGPRAPASDAAPLDISNPWRRDTTPVSGAATGGRCEACESAARIGYAVPQLAHTCHGTGRSPSTGGDK